MSLVRERWVAAAAASLPFLQSLLVEEEPFNSWLLLYCMNNTGIKFCSQSFKKRYSSASPVIVVLEA
ncbi:hypothetical protein E2C01_075762 [Portunus trituberculatus]|uniref:Uncharacterized protein n=1 Tax=Portunus trituberculatus TaxID=210409 RepID=A0A5B7IHX4_PORTR|nr:hypothetical protein [Portunus trituberculatus]